MRIIGRFRTRVEQRKHSDRLTLRQELLGYLERDQSPRGPTPQDVRSVRLESPDGRDVLFGHFFQPAGEVGLAVQAARPDAVERPLPAQALR